MFRKFVFASALVTAIAATGTSAFADPHAKAHDCNHEGMKGEDMGARIEQHLDRFKTELKITPEQQASWRAFADSVNQQAQQMKTAMTTMHQKTDVPAPERMNQRMQLMQQRLNGMQTVAQNFTQLYNGLTPEQKKIADQHAMQYGPH